MALQNHIHLAATYGSSPEYAPVYKWKVIDRLEIPVTFSSLRRTLTGKLRKHVLMSGGNPIQLTNWRYRVKVAADYGYTLAQRIDQLKGLQGKTVYLCDIFHAADGATHASDRKTVFVARVGEFPVLMPGLIHFYVDVELEDASL